MVEKRSRYSTSVKEKSINVETSRIPLDNFMTEFLSHCKEYDPDSSPKFVEVSVCILDALYLTLNNYRTLTVLKLPNCNINAYGIIQICCMLTDYNCLRDLNLDRNPNIQENYHLLCKSAGNLHYLSLQLCKITDEGMKKIADELQYADPPNEPKLLALNLSNNRIGDRGAEEIARMLRTNRSLRSLILTGNRICDDGAILIIQELNMSKLTHSEIVDLRRRRYDALILRENKFNDVNRTNGNEMTKIGEDLSNLEIVVQTKMINKVTNKSKKSKKLSLSNRSSKITVQENSTNVSRPSTMSEKNSIIEIDHPFGKESVASEGVVRISGNFLLKHLNLSFNHLSGKIIKKFIDCLRYQTYAMMSDTSRGLLYVRIEGNEFTREDDKDLIELEELLRSRQAGEYLSKSDDTEDSIPLDKNNDL
ncbi:leucine-rich repeat-containing protein 71-like [Polistes fuscatus]|uniref:leucine-rich repeat-containing protein 71-like n=1 Tax=Polistes fuscatus TaxID=30207 RepID=UPI001CA93415|nr:leucine-rich repeat-containing protein 71-like [Polistes fuscatus]